MKRKFLFEIITLRANVIVITFKGEFEARFKARFVARRRALVAITSEALLARQV